MHVCMYDGGSPGRDGGAVVGHEQAYYEDGIHRIRWPLATLLMEMWLSVQLKGSTDNSELTSAQNENPSLVFPRLVHLPGKYR